MDDKTHERRSKPRPDMPSGIFRYEVRERTLVLTISTETVDIYNVGTLLERTDKAFVELDFDSVIIDVTGLKRMDNSAAGALMVAMDRMKKRRSGGAVVVVTDNPAYYKLKHLYQYPLDLFPTVDEAMAFLRDSSPGAKNE